MNDTLKKAIAGLEERVSMHYRFHFLPGSAAERDIEHIIATQEDCFVRITAELKVMPDFPLHYILLCSDEEVGALYEASCGVTIGTINGFAAEPDTVVAVYSDEVQCIGMHEDTHLLADLVAVQWQSFIMEGLAMYMDGEWWGEPNERWVTRFLADGRYIPLAHLIPNDSFHDVPCEVSYPIAGAFTRYLIDLMGMETYLASVYAANCDADNPQGLPALLGKPINDIERDFLQWIRSQSQSYKG
ncbi:MAG: hypothetical protein IJZ74_11590 [Clostridia bacterium]|nr:hypothetical protein [Clostridia bacterium]